MRGTAARVLVASVLLLSTAPLAAQRRAAPVRAPRLDGLTIGVLGAQQWMESSNVPFRRDEGSGIEYTLVWGLRPQLALLASRSTAPVDFSGETYDVRHSDLLLTYQGQRGLLRAYPYIEAGISRLEWIATWDPPEPYRLRGWVPVLGAGVRVPVREAITIVAGLRVQHGNLDDQVVDGEVQPLTRVNTVGRRYMIGVEWHARPGPPRSPFFAKIPVSPRGLGLTTASTYAEGHRGPYTPMGSGATFGASWGFTDRVSVVARTSRDRLRRFEAYSDVRHREVLARFAPRGRIGGLRPYLEAGMTRVEHQWRALGVLNRDKGDMPVLGAGVFYSIRRDLDFDLGADFTTGRLDDGDAMMFPNMTTTRLRAGLEWRPPR